MPKVVIRVPDSLTLFSAYPFCKRLQEQITADEIVFDFQRTRTVEPFGMLVVASELKRFVTERPDVRFDCTNIQHMTYAGHMGFFKSFGHDFGRQPGEAFGGPTYIPITYFKTETLQTEANRAGHDVGEEVEFHSRRLSETLASSSTSEVFETLSYSIREIMRNVVEHARAKTFSICAQHWPTKGRAEVAIVDRGIGLKESLKPNHHINASDDKRAINYALMPAVSGKAFKGSRKLEKRGHWTNSGFGLYLTSRICRNGGNFFISSGDTGMLLTSGRDGKRYLQTSLCGTAVRLNIRTENLDSLKDALARFRDEGFEIQKKYREIVNIDPSAASLMLSQDFDLNLWDRLLAKLKLQ